MKLINISPSRIKTFDSCLFKYFLTYETDLVLKTNFGAVNGSLIHDILEHYANGKDTNWRARLFKGYAGTLAATNRKDKPILMESPLRWAKADAFQNKEPFCDTCEYKDKSHCSISLEPLNNLTGCPKDLFDKSLSLVSQTIESYEDVWKKILKNKDGVPIGTEYSFEIVVPGTDVPMIGIMDLVIEEDPETIHIIDYKTGVKSQSYQECLNDIQVKMYSLAARREFIDDIHKKGYKYKNIILTFDYFQDKPITLALTEEQDLETEKFVFNKIKEIQQTTWIHRIVKDNVNFDERSPSGGFKHFKCKYLCDSDLCSKQWKGRFEVK